MRGVASVALLAAGALAVAAAGGGCSKSERTAGSSAPNMPVSDAGASESPAAVVKESLPRCRGEGARLALPGDDVVVGDGALTADALLVGVVRREGTRRLAAVARASLDLTTVRLVEMGPALGDDAPPSPRLKGAQAFVASFTRSKNAAADGGAAVMGQTRLLEIARVEASGLVAEGSVVQQADESLAYDVAWPESGTTSALVAWDEDAPPRPAQLLADRGVVKVQLLAAGAKGRVASPETSDAEGPRLLARPGGYWLAWLARRPELGEDAGASAASEGPGERRAYRWVELVSLDAKGEAASPVRRISPEKGRVASFDLVRAGADGQLVILVQDEAAQSEGAGERIVRYAMEGDRAEGGDLLDGGVGHALAELVVSGGEPGASRWLAFLDPQERAHLLPLGPSLKVAGPSSTEPALDGARVLGASTPDVLYAVAPAVVGGARLELRRLVCR